MQDFFENAEPRMIAMMLIAIVLLVAAVEITYLLWPQLKDFRQLHASRQLLEQAVTQGFPPAACKPPAARAGGDQRRQP
jgi:hypothetical protein